ncbi:MAG TPA: cohesin domain-containing protein, partial [Bacteroidales bacterium]|nr:cohesin domain-containing protein [Bacteroidales bacterium]
MKYFKIIFALLFLPLISQAQAVYFRLGSGSNIQGTEVVIPVTVQNFSNLISMQGTVSFNPAVISFVNTENYGVSDLSPANFGTTNAATGHISFSWNDPDLSGVSLSDGDTIFCLRFLMIGSAGMSSVIEINDDITPIEVIDKFFAAKTVYTQSGAATVQAGQAVSGLLLSVDETEGLSGQSVQVPVTAQDFTDLLSAQGSIAFDPAIISFTGISGYGLPGMNASNFGISSAGSGIITFSWNDATLAGVSLIDGAEIFVLNFNIIGSAGQISPVQLTNNPTQLEFADITYSVVTYSLSQGSVTVGTPFIPEDIFIFADSIEGAMGQYVQVPVRVSDFSNIISAQGSLSFNPAIAQFDQIVSFGLADMTNANFGTTQAASGLISFSWNDPDLSGESLADSAIIFTLQFHLVGTIGQQTPLSFVNSPTPFEFVQNDFTVLNYSSAPGNIKIIDLYELEVASVSSTEICAGADLTIQYSAIGNYSAANVFTAFLSDASGSFALPVSIGSLTSNVSGSINVTIPANTATGIHYRIRVDASDPYYVGDANATDITIHAIPNANAGSDQDICIGNSVTLTATGGVSYAWNSGQNTGAITVSPALNTEYIVTVTDAFGCENSDTVNVVVHALPSANAGSDVNICFGESASLSASGGNAYAWNSGQNTADITVSPTATTQFIVSVTDIWSCQAADTVVVNVFQVFANAGSDEDICSGGSTLLTATGGTSYAWSTGQNTDAITVSPVVSSNYIVTVTGVNNCTDLDTVSVIVHAIPNANAGSDQDICIG